MTNKSAHGKQGVLVAMVRGTKSDDVIFALNKLLRHKRLKIKEITIDLSPYMKLIAKRAFPNATIVSDRFHVQKLINKAVSDLRGDYRWEAIDQENADIALAKAIGHKFTTYTFRNGDTRRLLVVVILR